MMAVQKLTLKIFLSFIATIYILMIVIFPNGGSFLGRTIGQVLLPIANTAALNTTWNFFSPDPAHTMYFSYSIHFEDDLGQEVKEAISGFLPEEKNKIVTDASKRRMLYAMRFLMLDNRRLNVLMAPWLCKKYSGASRVRVHSVIERIPSLDDVILKTSESVEGLRKEESSNSITFDCQKPQDEVSL